ncbi:MAG: hypothetical protein AB7J34_11230 [Limisphaerales bacterium]
MRFEDGDMTSDGTPSSGFNNLITKRELAARLRKTPRCIELWMKARYLPYIKIGHSILFDWHDVVASLKRFEVK